MLLRSSSTPILGSLLPSSSPLHYSESPICTTHHTPPPSFLPISCHFSPISDSSDSGGLRRTLSDGNLHSLDLCADDPNPNHRHVLSPPLRPRRCVPTLDTIPSFSIRNSGGVDEDEEEEPDQDGQDGGNGIFMSLGEDGNVGSSGMGIPPLFLARGLGIDRVGSGLLDIGGGGRNGNGGGRGGGNCVTVMGNGGEQSDVEMYYKRMVEEDPSNALLLRNYGQFLYQAKGDLRRAEEFFSRAILADPSDGEILSQYAKLVWELHGDGERAASYFEQAVQAAPQNSHVLAAYAGFLWEKDEDGGKVGEEAEDYAGLIHHGVLASATT
ncbi:uncharacterized protein [Typha latifolia]|uniref:uncharacterized protein n=1 Tax=Typha latifolia TaxID=4733 RepID=UPI003C2AF77D